jgi:Fic family protein
VAEFLHKIWEASPSGLRRSDRKPCAYEAYLPDKLLGRRFVLDVAVAAEVADAEAAIIRLNSTAPALAGTEILARMLLRAESVASSRIEGLEVGSRRLFHAAAAREAGAEVADVTATEILGNIDAMVWAIDAVGSGTPITPDLLLEAHRRLLVGTRMAEHAGRIRTVQNWIGGSGFNPCSAQFVPPPPERVGDLLADLCEFCNEDSMPAVAQAAIAHAQFETIHPFVDGNGRTGRVLIHLLLRRRGLAPRVLAPVSLILATWSADYVEALTRTRYAGPAESPEAQDAVRAWLSLFSAACSRAVADASGFAARMLELRADWERRLDSVRSGSATSLLLDALPSAPVLTATTASTIIGRSFQATTTAIARLVEAGILHQVTIGRRNRAFEVPEVLDAFTDIERRLASPEADTRVSPPARPVPRRSFQRTE